MSIYFPPVQIDPLGLPPAPPGDQDNDNFHLLNQTAGPFLANGALFIALCPQNLNAGSFFPPINPIDVWKSTDGGQTWVTLDHAHAPQGAQMVSAFDGSHTIGVCIWPSALDVTAALNCAFFDCLTETWGALSGPSGFSTNGEPLFMTFLPGGGNLIAFTSFVGIAAVTNGVIFNAGVWGASFSIDANAQAAVPNFAGAYNASFGVTDSAGNTHCFLGVFDVAVDLFMFYQQVGPTGALGAFFQFPNVGTVLNGLYGVPCIEGTNLVFPVGTLSGADNRTGLYVGAGLGVPVWTLFADIDPGMVGSASPFGGGGVNQCAAIVGGTVQIVAMWPTADADYRNGVIRLSTTSDFVHWVFTTVTAYNIETDGPASFQLSGSQYIACPAIGAQGLAVQAFDAAFTAVATFFFQPLAPPPAPPPLFTEPISGGGPPAILCPRPINLYDLCAEDEVRRTKNIHFPKACNIPECLLPWDEDYTPVPAGGLPFNIFGTIETPAPADGDVLVCSGRVPHGYDGLLTDIYQIYQGSGFQQGSGDIVWRIRRNQIWLKTLGNMPYSLGTPKSPVWLTQGEIMFSGTQFFFFVNVPNLSSMIQVGASTISCGMRGFYWPRG